MEDFTRPASRAAGAEVFIHRHDRRTRPDTRARLRIPVVAACTFDQKRSESIGYLKVDPGFDDLRDDPRFQDLLRRAGMSP